MALSINHCIVGYDAYRTMAVHAQTTEREEIMGLCIGRWADGVAYVWSLLVLTRSDRRPDRVEISPEQMSAALKQVDQFNARTKTKGNIVGWYHSHPHITVLPSHVDVRTQGRWQAMDPRFVGLIFSCFSTDERKGNRGRLQLIAFQASRGGSSSSTSSSSSSSSSSSRGGGAWEQKLVKLDVLDDPGDTHAPTTLGDESLLSLETLQRILSEERLAGYNAARARSTAEGASIDSCCACQHHTAVFMRACSAHIEITASSLTSQTRRRKRAQKRRLAEIERELDELLEEEKEQIIIRPGGHGRGSRRSANNGDDGEEQGGGKKRKAAAMAVVATAGKKIKSKKKGKKKGGKKKMKKKRRWADEDD